MSLKELNLKPDYDSDEDDILNDFYVPILSQSVIYRRLAGFFSSTTLAVAARGISNFIANGGHMKLVVNVRLSKEDIDAIQEGLENPEKAIEKIMITELSDIKDEFIRDHVSALGWMVANKMLEIKVAVVEDEGPWIYHQKVGIFEDKEGNIISFSGSDNESAAGWLGHVEEFKVFRSWVNGESKYVSSDQRKFEKYWNNNAKRAKVLDVPRAVNEKLIEIAPTNIEELNLKKWLKRKVEIKKKVIELRDYQKQAIQNWFNNDKKGIFEMATGTGKTYTALGCLKRLLKEKGKLAAVITCPYAHLIEQWIDDLKDFKLNGVKAYGSYNQWKDNIANAILNYNNGYSNIVIILTTHDTFYSENFKKAIQTIDDKILLIADEVHSLGSPKRRCGFIENYVFRIGLSATPTRWFDDEGTQILKKYFSKTIFEFSLKKAIEQGYLTPYEYYPHFVSLTPEELEQYQKETKKIAREYAKNKEKESKWLELLCIIRQKIVTNAIEKYDILEDILNKQKDLSFCLVYCSPEQIDKVQEILNRRGIINHRFTARESIPERKELLKGFSKRAYNVLVAMNCLDEGVDVPATRTAIIMASSGNPRQYIQRRGRILRKCYGKEKAIIHDFIVIADISKEDPDLFQLERKIMRKELRRYMEFAGCSMNRLEALNIIYPYMKKFDVYGGNIDG